MVFLYATAPMIQRPRSKSSDAQNVFQFMVGRKIPSPAMMIMDPIINAPMPE